MALACIVLADVNCSRFAAFQGECSNGLITVVIKDFELVGGERRVIVAKNDAYLFSGSHDQRVSMFLPGRKNVPGRKHDATAVGVWIVSSTHFRRLR